MLFEALVEAIVESVLQLWMDFRRKNDPGYHNNRLKKVITVIIGILLSIGVMALFLGLFASIEAVKPELFDIIGLD